MPTPQKQSMMRQRHPTYDNANPDSAPTGKSNKLTVQDTSRAGAEVMHITQTELTIPEGFDAAKAALPFEMDIVGQFENDTISGHLARYHG